MEEERRLAFVALTRAKKELYLSEAQGILHSGYTRYPSRFLFDLGLDNVKWNPEIPKDMQEGAKRMISLKKNLLAKPEQSDVLSVGDVVEHPVFGQGVIQEILAEQQAGAKRMISLKKNLLAKPEQSDVLSVGDVVEHPVFGQGVIQEILAEQQAIVIQFDKLNTTRTLSTRVRLKKVESKMSTPWLN